MSRRIPRKVCPVGTCAEPVRIDRIMCLAHWRLVDPKLKRANARAYRAFLTDRKANARTLRETNDACIADAEAKS